MSLRLSPLLFAVLLLIGCAGNSEPTAAPSSTIGSTSSAPAAPSSTEPDDDREPLTVVVLGSSTAAGLGLEDPEDAWPAVWEAGLAAERPGSEVVNLAVPGFTTFHVLPDGTQPAGGRPAPDPAHNITAALALDPDVIVVNLPSNDTAIGVPVSDQIANLDEIYTTAERAGVQAWVTTMQPRALDDAGRAALEQASELVLEQFGDHAVNVWSDLAAPDGRIASPYDSGDGIHLSPDGHRLIAARFLRLDISA